MGSGPDDDDTAVCFCGAKPGDRTFADVIAVNGEIVDLLAPKPIGFTDDQLAMILRLARGMSQAGRARYLSEIARRLSSEPTDDDVRLAIALAATAAN
jgi:hypothetical protein